MPNRPFTARAWRAWGPVALSAVLAAGAAACGTPTPPTPDAGADAVVDTPPPPPPPAIVHLNVDSNRNGVIETTDADRAHRAEWSTTFGAMFLANVDDDDEDHAVDSGDEVVNGAADEDDLARIQ